MGERTEILNLTKANRWRWWMLFGEPVDRSVSVRGDTRIELLVFSPDTLVGLSRQWLNDYGIITWETFILRTLRPHELGQVVYGVRPGAEVICHTDGKAAAKAVRSYLDELEELGLKAADMLELHRAAAPYLRAGVCPRGLVADFVGATRGRGER